ncbi:NAD(+)/NADH kinase [Pontiella sulfatireligans]|uniref:NAD kinase n=1 Tax=Pontiella sulfatireligans TaxID=2750658 RepID=A0A6C2ULL8_9BACT|nr:NAD(+)/NADH kinase [Pontiella sulfatireligans]VGO21152.1 NAD kinase [Pontiella sulfatireligans]
MKNIGVIVNTKRPRAGNVLGELRSLAEGHGFKLYAEDAGMAKTLGAEHIPVEDFGRKVDMTLAMGGDGTVLYTARALHGFDVPIMGINLGSLGFLTSVGDTEMRQALEAIATKNYKVSTREVAECRIFQNGDPVGEERALNDIVLGWGASSRIVTLKLSIDGELVGSFMCDGMMVSTPTGSTGHSLSAGGPILHPGVGGFGINVICPHTLSSRPLVIPNSSLIEIEVANAAKSLILSIDGQDEYKVKQGGRIKIRKSPHEVKFLQLAGHSYFSVLAKKLHWRGSSL